MTWQDYADKHVNSPVVFVDIDFASGERNYSTDYIRIAGKPYKGNLLNLLQISSSIGDIKRTFERSEITLLFNDSDYEFRGLEESESPHFKNRTVIIKIAFQDDDYATTLTLFTGQIYDWRRLDDLRFEFNVEEKQLNLENEYPDKVVERSDYPNADSSAIGAVILIPYGAISAYGMSNDGAFGHPSLTNSTGLPFVDTTVDAEKHLVGLQVAEITVNRVYKNGILQTLADDYTMSTSVVDGKTHTLINWVSGINPEDSDLISCDISFGSRRPVEAIKHFLENFCGYASGNFNTTSYDTARTKEDERTYDFAGALWSKKVLKAILDVWRNEYELDIFWNKDSEICFNYLTAFLSYTPKQYTDLRDILEGFDSDPQVPKLINYLKYGYMCHYSKTYFYNFDYFEDTDSQTKYGATFKEDKNFYWIRESAIAYDIAMRKVTRFKDPITFDQLRLPLKTFSDDLTEVLEITHFEGLGSSGYDKKRFQIRETQYNIDEFVNEMLIEDVSVFMGIPCRLGDDTVLPASWAVAAGSEREYCYLCDITTGLFLDGEPGKNLYD